MSEPSPFAALARARGAVLREHAGALLAATFGDPLKEAADARRDAALFDRSYRAALRFTGSDRASFLHNLLSNDIASLRPGTGCYATLLTRESRVVADGDVLALDEVVRFEIDRAVKDRARQHLEKFLVAEDVEIEDGSDEALLGIHGPRAPEVLESLGVARPAAALEHGPGTIGGVAVRVIRSDWTGEPGFDLVAPRGAAERLWEALVARGAPLGLRPAGMAAANILRIEAGIPWIGVDFDETNLVLEAGLERGIHLRKGCYLGQEIVERASARGRVQKRLVCLRIEGEITPRAGAPIVRGGAEIGRITSAVFSPHLRAPIAFGYAKRGSTDPGTRLEVEAVGAMAAAEVVAPPFYRPR